MNSSNGRMFYATGIDNSQLRSDAAESRNILHSISQQAKKESVEMDNAFLKIGKSMASAFALSKLKEFAGQIISLRSEIQKLEISFQTLAGKSQGEALFKEIKEFAVQTPMMLKDLAAGAQTMLAFNIETEKVMPMLKAIGDISMGDAQKFNSLALAFSQASATGKLMGQDLMQMINAGFNPLSVISEKTGKSIGDLKKEMESGKITVKMMEDAFISATSEGGKFNGMLKAQAEGIAGAQAQLSGAIDDMMNEIGKASEGTIVSLTHAATELVQNYEQVGRVILGLVTTYGVYRASLATAIALEGWACKAEALRYNWLLLVEKAQKMLNATMLNNPYVLVATLIAGVVAALVSMKNETERIRDAEKRYEEQKQKVIEKEQEHKREIEQLCSVAGDEALATDTRRAALFQLEQKYPDIFAKYATEYDMLCDIKKIKQEIAALDGQNSIQNTDNELNNVNTRIKELEELSGQTVKYTTYEQDEHYPGRTNRVTKSKRRGLTRDEQAELKMLEQKRKSLNQKKDKEKADNYFANLTGISNTDLDSQIKLRNELLARIETKETATGKKINGYIADGPTSGSFTKDELKAQRQALEREKERRKNENETYSSGVSSLKKQIAAEEKKLAKLKKSGKTSEVKEVNSTIESLKKKLKDEYGVNLDSERKAGAKAGAKAANTATQNTDMLANEAANRRKQEEEYAKQIADQAKDNELEIAQARIDGMEEGIDKELAQNQLNYDRIKLQQERNQRDMLDNLADQKIRELEDADPTIFKKKDKDGKWEEDPGKREEKYREIRAKLTIEDLDEQQQAAISKLGELAISNFEKENKKVLDKMLQDVLSYEQQRTKTAEEYSKKRADLYEKETYTDTDGKEKTRIKKDAEGKNVFRQGASRSNLEEIDRQETEALKAIDEQFAQREETYKAWCEQISSFSLEQLEQVLKDAEKRLEDLKKSGSTDGQALAQARAQVNTARDAVSKAKAKNDLNPGIKTVEKWEDLYKTLSDVESKFESLGDTVGGVVGDIMKKCGSFTTSTLSMINGIVQLANWSAISIKMTNEGVSAAMQTMEKASVILTVISAAMQIAMQIASLFNNDKKKQKEIDSLQERIDQLQWELDHQEIGRVQQQYGTAIERMNKAIAQTRQELAAGTTGWQRFLIMTGNATKNTELLQGSAEKLAALYANMDYTVDKALGAKKYEDANERLKNLAQQQLLLQEQIRLEASKKDTDEKAIAEMEQTIEEKGQEMIEIINELVEDIIGDTSTGLAEKLADAFIDAFQAGEDAAEAWGDKVNDIVADILKRMLISKFLEQPLGEILDKYKGKWFKDGQFQGLDAVINSMQEFASDLNAVGTDFATIWDEIPDNIKQMFKVTDAAAREASQKGIATASQESVDELNGRATAIQSHTFSIMENTKLMLSTTQSILKSVMSIDAETNGLGWRLSSMESSLKEVRDTLGDISTKGIRLKN